MDRLTELRSSRQESKRNAPNSCATSCSHHHSRPTNKAVSKRLQKYLDAPVHHVRPVLNERGQPVHDDHGKPKHVELVLTLKEGRDTANETKVYYVDESVKD
jgi:hypothetical protein